MQTFSSLHSKQLAGQALHSFVKGLLKNSLGHFDKQVPAPPITGLLKDR